LVIEETLWILMFTTIGGEAIATLVVPAVLSLTTLGAFLKVGLKPRRSRGGNSLDQMGSKLEPGDE
jgi:hypothetical protein